MVMTGVGFPDMAAAKNKAAKKSESQANRLVKVANSIELFRDANEDAYATLPVKGHRETSKVRSRAFKRWLAGTFYRTTQQVPQAQAMADAVNTLEGLAIFDGEEIETHIRLAEHDGKVYLDLANDAWQAVEIGPDVWTVVDDPPVKFLRPAAMMMLPTPVHGGSINELQKFVNVGQDFQLLVAFLVCALRPAGPYFCLNIGGEKGSAKSCLIDFIRMLIDPNKASVRSAPRSEDDLLIAAKHSWLLTADNLSDLPPWLSNAWCRLATGGGISKRELYTDDDEVILTAKRPSILAGITEVVTSSDLVDRLIRLECPTIPDDRRKLERTLRAEFEDARPRILGAILDGIAAALRNIGTFELPEICRMADGSEWCCAAWPAFGWESSEFLEAYRENRSRGRHLAIEAEPVGPVLIEWIEKIGGTWSGTATALLDDLCKHAGFERDGDRPGKRRPKGWPGGPHILSGKLRVLASDLRVVGMNITFDKDKSKARRKLIVITTVAPDPAPGRLLDAPGGAEKPIQVASVASDASGAATQHMADGEGVVESFRAELTTYFANEPGLPELLDLYDQWVDLYHESDEHPLELAARMAFEKVVADQERGAA